MSAPMIRTLGRTGLTVTRLGIGGAYCKTPEGYRAALEANGIAPEERLIMPGQYNFESGADRAGKLLGLAQPPTAIFACNDEIAAGACVARGGGRVIELIDEHGPAVFGLE